MSKKPFDLLATEKEPILFFEKTIIRMDDGELVALNKIGRFVIQPASTLIIYLGAGTSITQEASIFCALHDCFIAFSRGGCYVHSVWHSGRWSDPSFLVNQSLLHSNDEDRLYIAKKLILRRMENEFLTDETRIKIESAVKINELLGYEANWAKNIYREESELLKIKFKRDFNSNDFVNKRLNLLNNALYSIVTSIILATGLHPSVGFIHGRKRRGGLAFDIADIYKYELTIKPAFRMPENFEFKQIMLYLNKDIKSNNFKIVNEIVDICLKLGNGDKNIC
jgi:CRISPR-associated endonuclease Cas1